MRAQTCDGGENGNKCTEISRVKLFGRSWSTEKRDAVVEKKRLENSTNLCLSSLIVAASAAITSKLNSLSQYQIQH